MGLLLITGASGPVFAGQSPKPFRALVDDFEGSGTRRTAGLLGSTVGVLEGDAMISQPEPPNVSRVGIQSSLERRGFPDGTVTWLFEFRRKGVLRLTVRFADGTTGTVDGAYSTKGSRVTYSGTMSVNNGLSGSAMGNFRLLRNKFIFRDRIVFSTQTLRSKQVFRRDESDD